MKTTGIFGGSFNPVHVGHLILAQIAAEAAGLDEVLFIPAAAPPHKCGRTLACAHHRLAMLRRAVRGNRTFSVSDLELQRDAPSYTFDTVCELSARSAGEERLALILGADSVRDIHTWYRAPELLDSVEVIGLRRPGVEEATLFDGNEEHLGPDRTRKLRACFQTVPLLDISSSDIRQRIRDGRTIRYLVPEPVRNYIVQHQLYAP